MRNPVISAAVALLFMAPAVQAADRLSRDKVEDGVTALKQAAQTAIGRDEVPGLSVAVVWQDQVVYLDGFGVRVAGQPAKVDADTVFQIASCSKPISATVVAALVGDKALSWDSRIADLDPGFRLADAYPSQEVTVADLFAHRSGLPGNAGNELEALGYGRNDILYRLRLVKPASSFRAGYAYSNFGLTEGAVAAARAIGKPWEDVEEERLFKPLGMTSTSGRYRDFLARPNRAEDHVRVGGVWTALVKRDPDAQSPAGGVSSSARDLAQWMRLVLANGTFNGEPLVSANALARSHQPVTARGPDPVLKTPDFYALGWGIGYRSYGEVWSHAGAFSDGVRSLVTLVPGAQLGIVVLSNGFPTGAPEGIAQVFFDQVFTGHSSIEAIAAWDKVYDSFFGPVITKAKAAYGAPPADAAPALAANAYVGRYANPYIGVVAVEERDGALQMRLGPHLGITLPLRHFNRDVFTVNASPETPDYPTPVTFEIDGGGKATQVTIDALNDAGMGVLRRTE